MNEETRNKETGDTLSRWWWPGQWLRIVWGVWVDQKWYWRNVRPRLRGRKQGWGILVQGMLGTALVAPILAAVMGVILGVAGVQVNWSLLTLGVVAGLTVNVAFGGLAGVIRGVAEGLILYAVLGPVLCVTLGVIWGVGIAVDEGIRLGLTEGMVLGVALGMALGVTDGVREGVGKGVRLNEAECTMKSIGWAVLVGLGIARVGSVAGGTAAGVALVLGVYLGGRLGGRWATRQIPDAAIRKCLANPNAHLPPGGRYTA